MDTHVVEVLAALLGGGFVTTFAVWMTRRIRAGWRWTRTTLDNLTLLIDTSETLKTDVAWVAKELRPNGGGSLRDIVNRMERLLVFERVARRVSVTDVPMFERSEQGDVLYVSPAFSLLTGLTTEHCQDGGWARAVSSEERARVLRAFAHAQRDLSFFGEEFYCVHATTQVRTRVRVEEVPVFYSEQLVGWLGRWSPVA